MANEVDINALMVAYEAGLITRDEFRGLIGLRNANLDKGAYTPSQRYEKSVTSDASHKNPRFGGLTNENEGY